MTKINSEGEEGPSLLAQWILYKTNEINNNSLATFGAWLLIPLMQIIHQNHQIHFINHIERKGERNIMLYISVWF